MAAPEINGVLFATHTRLSAKRVAKLSLQSTTASACRTCSSSASGSSRPGTAHADNQHARGEQPLLALDANLRQQDLAAVAEQLRVVHAGILEPSARNGQVKNDGTAPARACWGGGGFL